MKRSEIEIGKVYAYTRHNDPTSTHHISGFLVESLEPVTDWRGNNKQEVRGRFTNDDGTPRNYETDQTSVNIRRLIGDYLPLRHSFELKEKNKEIARLKKEIASKQMTDMIQQHHELITKKLEINRYDIRNNYDGTVNIALNQDQLYKLVWAFQALNRHEEHAQRLETERLRKAYEESQETVNA